MLKRKKDIQIELFEACRSGSRAAIESLLGINQAIVNQSIDRGGHAPYDCM